MTLSTPLETNFVQALERIAADLLVALQIKHRAEVAHLGEALFRWVDFRLRYVDPRPRAVFLSDRFPDCVPTEKEEALEVFLQALQRGGDVNPFQGRGLTEHHDTSSLERQRRTDRLWADWGILHFHLTTQALQEDFYYSARSPWLVFAFFNRDEVALIDIRSHNERNVFEKVELAETLVRNWPRFMESYKMPRMLAGAAPTSDEIRKLRYAGISCPLIIGADIYRPPGLGVTTASTSQRVTMVCDKVRRAARVLARLVIDPAGEFQALVRDREIQSPSFELGVTLKGFCVIEEVSQTGWFLSRHPGTILSELNDVFAPEWLCSQLTEKT